MSDSSIDINNPAFIQYLLFHLLRCEQLLSRVVTQLDPSVFNRAGEVIYQTLWAWGRYHYQTYGQPIPRTVLETGINARLQEGATGLSEQDQVDMWALVDHIYAKPESEFAVEYAVQLAQSLLDERIVKTAAVDIQFAHTAGDIIGRVDELHNAVASTRITSVEPDTHLFDPKHAALAREKRDPTGVNFFDCLIGGGVKVGDVIGVLAPTGGGKTTLGVQLQCEYARSNRHVAYFSYETAYFDEISRRSYAYAAGIKRDDIHHLDNIDGLLPADRERLNAFLTQHGKYILPFDMLKGERRGVGNGGVPELQSALDDCKRKGNHVGLVIIDQFLPMVTRYCQAQGLDLASNQRVVMYSMVSALERMAQPNVMNCAVVLLHQVGTHAQGASWRRRPEKADAAEYKGFDQFMQACVAFGKQDGNHRCWFKSVKARDAEEQAIVVEVHKDYRINFDEDGGYKPGSKCFVKANADIAPVDIPSEGIGATTTTKQHPNYDADDKDTAT